MIQRFNNAARLARDGRFEESLEAWTQLLEPDDAEKTGGPPRVITGDFLGQATMRKAWVLMDLERYAEARAVFESSIMQACVGQFSMAVLYEYFFSYGNALGNLGDIDGMDDKLTRAMCIAAQELGDYSRLRACWRNLLTHAKAARAWEYLARECDACISLATREKDVSLAHEANRCAELAAQELGTTHV